jgi:diacylglycerol kinase (ATP)
MPASSYIFVVNPISGGNDKTSFYRFVDEVSELNRLKSTVFKTTGDNDEVKLRKLVGEERPDVIVAVGGDGTLLLVAKIVRNSSVKIGLMPFGSANGMSKELNIPKIPDIKLSLNRSERFAECWNIIRKEHVREIDLLQINKKHYSLHLSDIGLNAKIVKRFEKGKIRGHFGYARLFLKEIKQKKRISYRLNSDDGNFYRGRAYMIVIANATMYGTGAVINPIGKLSDGVFEICLLKRIKFITLLRSVLSIFKKELQPRRDLMHIVSCKKASIELKEPETLQVDGEVIGEVKKATVSILPRALQIITPN